MPCKFKFIWLTLSTACMCGKSGEIYKATFLTLVRLCNDRVVVLSPSVVHIHFEMLFLNVLSVFSFVVFTLDNPGTEKFNNWGSPDSTEAYHRNLNASLSSRHPNIATLVDFTLELQATAYIKIRCLDHVYRAIKLYGDLRRVDIELYTSFSLCNDSS